ncbi:TfoX/Sxy family protein [Actibacterium pelagium]|uniref:Cold-shock protein n=1 Tax=Actibacterium pelagium TaxID=2029103 RepID=A0A917EHS7_9RHOB|nr:TfoX/Sxy family protein [Actibacterium pelagium]GGE43868.1 cold-shock protein [Actibacterium pelagium]
MAYDEGLATILRDDLTEMPGITEKKMFGGLCFLLNGNMLCGVHKDGAMFRVGKDNEAEAMAIDGAGPMEFTGRKMGGMIDVSDDGLVDDASRAEWLRLSLDFVKPMPAK